MLQQPALEAWNHEVADHTRTQIDYSGVFVATDVSWSAQVASLGFALVNPEHRRIVSGAAFVYHVLRSMTEAMEWRISTEVRRETTPHRRIVMSQETETKLVQELAAAWRVMPTLLTLSSLRYSLRARLSEIYGLMSREATLGEGGRAERLAAHQYLHLPLLPSCGLGVEVFNSFARDADGRWALLFDELELAPEWIREDLFRSLRSTDDRLLFKLSMSPYDDRLSTPLTATSPMEGHDYDTIRLWYVHKEDGYPFCRALWDAMLRARGLPPTAPEQALRRSFFETDADEWTETKTAYSPGSRHHKLIIEAAKSDATVRRYLESAGIDPVKPQMLDGDERAKSLRKIVPLLLTRTEFRKADRLGIDQKPTLRSRKATLLYTGAEALFAVVEGNPRWFIGIVDRLLKQVRPDHVSVSRPAQAREIDRASSRFGALLRTIACPPTTASTGNRGILPMLDLVGSAIFKSVVLDEFKCRPTWSFIVDSNTDDSVLQIIGRALNAGAIVHVPDEGGGASLLRNLRGRRFRLAYLLAPRLQIPIRLGRGVALSRLLGIGESEQSLFTERTPKK